ncbi:MAG: sulfotransferase domain-containing protein, partial [Gammaproteobacteria bacterium]
MKKKSLLTDEKLNLFVVFGMPRTGTTYLYHSLSKHPSIFIPYRKESLFFTVNYENGFDWFHSLYEGATEQQLAADVNPVYYLDPRSEQRILQYDSKIKLVLGVRDPTDFAISLYGNALAHGVKAPPIVEWVQRFDWSLSTHESLEFSLLDLPMRRRITELCKTFTNRILLYDYRHFQNDPLSVLQTLECYLRVPNFFTDKNVDKTRINASGRHNPLFMNILLANPKFLETVYRVVPNKGIRYCKIMYDRMIARKNNARAHATRHKTNILSEKERDTLKDLFAQDTVFYNKLFESSPFVLG